MITSDIIKTLLNLYGNVVNDVSNDSNEKLIQLLEEQLAQSNKRNEELLKQIESLSQQVRYLTKLLYGSKSEKSKYQAPDGQCSLFDDDSFFLTNLSTQKNKARTLLPIQLFVKYIKRNETISSWMV